MTICPANPQRFVNFLVNAIWTRVRTTRIAGDEEIAWNQMVHAALNGQYIAAAVEAGRHPETLRAFEMAIDADQQLTH